MTLKPYIIDSTLRDGEQAPGVVFSDKEKIRIVRMLDEIGIDEIEAGTPGMGNEECAVIRQLSRLRTNARISVWSRALKKDIELAASTEADGIHIAFPVSEIQLASINKNWQWLKDTLPQMVEHAHRYFAYVSVGAQDASRCGMERLLEYIAFAEKQNICRIRIADTVGLLTPLSTLKLIQQIKKTFPLLGIDFHGHDDLGMATANAVTAWQAGASDLSVTVNGLGERAGNAALEEVLTALSLAHNQHNYNLSSLFSLCKYVAGISGRPIPAGKAICGSMAFSHESGIHAKSSLVDTTAFQAFDGRLIGRESSRIIFGKHSGKAAVINFFKKQNINISDQDIPPLMSWIRETAIQNKRNVYPFELLAAYQTLLNSRKTESIISK